MVTVMVDEKRSSAEPGASSATDRSGPRRLPRQKGDFRVILKTPYSVVTGRALDSSLLGLFILPEESFIDGELLNGSAAIERLEAHNVLWVIILSAERDERAPIAEFPAAVRWKGYSQENQCYGLGLENLAVTVAHEPEAPPATRAAII
jgi:hypothetical protein